MRMFDDAQGRHWQAATMDASYGEVLLIFGRIGGPEVLQASLAAEAANVAEAEQFVEALDEDGLRRLLAKASPWDGNA
ncbi:MAG: hypothetical protein ABI299_03445 [Rhodanobacter sp.]